MSIDERLRTGLTLNTDHLVPDVEHELATTYGRARGRRRVRRGAIAVTIVAAVAVTAGVLIAPDPDEAGVFPVTKNPSPIDLVGVHGLLEPGTYSLAVWGDNEAADSLPRAIVDVPSGYFSHGGWVIDPGSDGSPEFDEFGELSVWNVDRVPTDPCRRSTATAVGPTVADLARAMVRQAGPSTRPTPVVLDGYRGLYLELSMPPSLDPSRCTDGTYVLWTTKPGAGSKDETRQSVNHHLWILDVDGTRLVVLVGLYPDQDPAQHHEQLAIAETIRFEPAS